MGRSSHLGSQYHLAEQLREAETSPVSKANGVERLVVQLR